MLAGSSLSSLKIDLSTKKASQDRRVHLTAKASRRVAQAFTIYLSHQIETIEETCPEASLCLKISSRGWSIREALKSPTSLANRQPSQPNSLWLWLVEKVKAELLAQRSSQISQWPRISRSTIRMRKLQAMVTALRQKFHSKPTVQPAVIISTHMYLNPIWSSCTWGRHSNTSFLCSSTSAIWSKLLIWMTN